MSEVRDLIIKEELIGEIKRLAEENQLYAENEARFVKKILALNNKVANLHKVISKLQTKVARQKENITTLLHLYTSGKRSKSHKKLREKYRALKARIAELEAENEKINYFFRRLRMFCIFAHWDNPNTEAEFYKVDAEIREYLSEYKVCIDQLTAHDAIERQDDKWIPEVQE